MFLTRLIMNTDCRLYIVLALFASKIWSMWFLFVCFCRMHTNAQRMCYTVIRRNYWCWPTTSRSTRLCPKRKWKLCYRGNNSSDKAESKGEATLSQMKESVKNCVKNTETIGVTKKRKEGWGGGGVCWSLSVQNQIKYLKLW